MSSKVIETSWEDYLKHNHTVLFNAYPEIVNKLGADDDIPVDVLFTENGEARKVYQWHIIGVDYHEAEKMAEETKGEVAPFYSEALRVYILPVHHSGTAWDNVSLEVIKDA